MGGLKDISITDDIIRTDKGKLDIFEPHGILFLISIAGGSNLLK